MRAAIWSRPGATLGPPHTMKVCETPLSSSPRRFGRGARARLLRTGAGERRRMELVAAGACLGPRREVAPRPRPALRPRPPTLRTTGGAPPDRRRGPVWGVGGRCGALAPGREAERADPAGLAIKSNCVAQAARATHTRPLAPAHARAYAEAQLALSVGLLCHVWALPKYISLTRGMRASTLSRSPPSPHRSPTLPPPIALQRVQGARAFPPRHFSPPLHT